MEPVNIQRLVRQNEQYAAASQHAQSITKGSIVSGWHEEHDRRGHTPGVGECLCFGKEPASTDAAASMHRPRVDKAVAVTSSRSTSSGNSSLLCGAGRGAANQELEHAKQALLQGRQQRLEQLYLQERLQHELELQGLGLALLKQQH